MQEYRKEVNKEKGRRLRECRKLRNMTQAALAEVLERTDKYISMVETGDRDLHRNLAHAVSSILNVPEAYLLCETDSILHTNTLLHADSYAISDDLLLRFLGRIGYTIEFYAIREFTGTYDEDGNLALVTLKPDQLIDFCFSSPLCKYESDEGIINITILDVSINNYRLPFATFIFIINRLYDFIRFTFDSINSFVNDYAMLKNSNDAIRAAFPSHIDTDNAAVKRREEEARSKLITFDEE